ncbi:MAG: ubiquinone/menaquinone biosynthesis methyltransferase [Candidatus Omnitrophica bacterium]|nr:ubiquinone/menaquinone biosynthesis methyltransferase [Candidatus Omnitrophota bacterium]
MSLPFVRSGVPNPPDMDTPVPADIRETFSFLAGRYDLFNALASIGMDGSWRKKAAGMAVGAMRPGSRVLDLCAGTGDLAIEVASLDRYSRIEALDFCPEMVEIGKAKARAKKLEGRINWTVADASDMPYANGTFDAITCGFALRNMQKYLDKVFAESCRVLKPDGFMIALDLTRPEGRARKALHGIYLKCALPVIGFIIYGRTSPFRYLGGSISGFYTAEEVKEKFLKAGFRECRYETAGFGAAGIYTAVK